MRLCEDETALVGCKTGAYRVLIKGETPQLIGREVGHPVERLSFEASATFVSGVSPELTEEEAGLGYGIACWSSFDDDDGYFFLIFPDGP